MTEPRGPDLGNAHCPGCGWSYELHPLDEEGVDIGRCMTEAEGIIVGLMLTNQERLLRQVVQAMPRADRSSG